MAFFLRKVNFTIYSVVATADINYQYLPTIPFYFSQINFYFAILHAL